MNQLRRLLSKELKVELRGRETISLIFCNVIILSVFIGAGVSALIVEQRLVVRFYPLFILLVFLSSTTVSLMRSHEAELEERGIDGLILTGFSGANIFTAKVIVLFLLLLFAFLLSGAALSLALSIPYFSNLRSYLILGGVCSLGIASLAVVVGGISGSSRMRGVLLPVLLLPLLTPYFLGGIELATYMTQYNEFPFSSVWTSILIGSDVVFFLLGLNLYEFLLRE